METIRIRYLCEDLPPIAAAPGGDWVDLRAAEDIEMKAGEFRLIPLGVAMQLPEGYEAHIAPRSSTFRNFGLLQTNSVGVVDGSYCGDNDEHCCRWRRCDNKHRGRKRVHMPGGAGLHRAVLHPCAAVKGVRNPAGARAEIAA